ncbi:trypsin-like peptidase domain-containing protein [Saccharothrix sp.]|uniref:S1 family peptidase n=1 Tax=Saccharothrix sp. TaxID=1873460 RepID=UPI0028110871|nr:trypsin-like peptidase domain-containing protein [Saccharothrix sp.]
MRVWRDDTPVGAGFLAGPRHVLTAAHVVATALDVPDTGPRPDGPVQVDFPLLTPGRRQPARIAAWVPVGDDMGGDIAGLELPDPPPEGAAPLELTRSGGLTPDHLVMVGFPRRLEIGSWVYGRRAGPVATGWVEIHREPGREAKLEAGFSGTAVWGPDLAAAVGMVVRRVSGAPPKLGYMITVDTLLSAWPALADVIEREPPFRALRPFDERDADLFFGRDEPAERLAKRVRTAPVVCVVGPSGVGKSSLRSCPAARRSPWPRWRTRRTGSSPGTCRPGGGARSGRPSTAANSARVVVPSFALARYRWPSIVRTRTARNNASPAVNTPPAPSWS